MDFWIVEKPFMLCIIAAHTAEEAIDIVIEARNQDIWFGTMDEEDKNSARNGLVATKMVMPDVPAVIAEYRE